MQEAVRKHTEEHWSLDSVALTFDVTEKTSDEVKSAPISGFYIRGLFLENARFEGGALGKPSQKNYPLRCCIVRAVTKIEMRSKAKTKYGPYGPFNAPLYRDPMRREFLTEIALPTDTLKPSLFILQGSALLLSIE